MFTKTLFTSMAALMTAGAILASPISYAYDKALAESYASMFQPVVGAKAGKALHVMKPDVLVEGLKQGKQVVAVDIRTEKETGLFTLTIPGSLSIPLNKLFLPENLDQLPTDKIIVMVCQSGVRASAAATALRHIGFENTYILKGGFKGLAAYAGPKEANTPPKVMAEKVTAK